MLCPVSFHVCILYEQLRWVKEVAGPDTFRESGALHAMQTRLNVGKKKKKRKGKYAPLYKCSGKVEGIINDVCNTFFFSTSFLCVQTAGLQAHVFHPGTIQKFIFYKVVTSNCSLLFNTSCFSQQKLPNLLLVSKLC